MKKIKSLEHALEVLGHEIHFNLMPEALKALGFPEHDIPALVAHYQITLIIEANNYLNKWGADWGNTSQKKYSVWQYVEKDSTKPAGFGFSYTYCAYWSTLAHVGSRLLVGTSEEAIYIGTDFKELFETAWLILPKVDQE